MDKPMLNDDPNVTLTIRLIMQGKVKHFFLSTVDKECNENKIYGCDNTVFFFYFIVYNFVIIVT